MVAATAVPQADSASTEESAPRPSLSALAAQGQDALLAELHRALPGGEPGQVAVAAFNSSI